MTNILNQLSAKSAFLFDMDGTLVNTEILHARAAHEIIQDEGIDVNLMESIHNYYGMADTEVLKLLIPGIDDHKVNEIINKKNKHLIEILHGLKEQELENFITPGTFEFLDYLNNLGKSCAVVSASEDIIVYETLKCFGLDKKVKLQMGRNQTRKTKPHPDPYLEAIKRLATHASETVIFEDSPTGILSASQVGCEVYRVTEFAHCNLPLKVDSTFVEIKNFHSLFKKK